MMGGFKRRYWRFICCRYCEKGWGAPRLYERAKAKRAWKREAS